MRILSTVPGYRTPAYRYYSNGYIMVSSTTVLTCILHFVVPVQYSRTTAVVHSDHVIRGLACPCRPSYHARSRGGVRDGGVAHELQRDRFKQTHWRATMDIPKYITNVTDPSYQVDKAFGPTNDTLWGYPMELDGWTRAHNAIRSEIDQMTGIIAKLGSKPLAAWEIESMQAWWKGHEVHIHDHHQNEDDKFMPFMRQRVVLPAKLEKDHAWLVGHMEKIAKALAKLTNASELAPLWSEYNEKMRAHLLEEEEVCLPLLRAYFTPKETAKLVQEILGQAPALAMGSFLYCLGGKEGVREFMAQEGIPFFVWYIQFAGQIAVYEKEMTAHVVALMTGHPPVQPPAIKVSTVLVPLVALAIGAYYYFV